MWNWVRHFPAKIKYIFKATHRLWSLRTRVQIFYLLIMFKSLCHLALCLNIFLIVKASFNKAKWESLLGSGKCWQLYCGGCTWRCTMFLVSWFTSFQPRCKISPIWTRQLTIEQWKIFPLLQVNISYRLIEDGERDDAADLRGHAEDDHQQEEPGGGSIVSIRRRNCRHQI